MNKKLIFIIVGIAILGIALWLYFQNKKKAAATTVNAGLASNLLSAPITTQEVKTTPFVAPTPNPANTSTNVAVQTFERVFNDSSDKHGSILRHKPANIPIVPGDSILIPSGPYAGKHTVWYVYDGARSGEPSVKNLYIEQAYVADASGTFTKV